MSKSLNWILSIDPDAGYEIKISPTTLKRLISEGCRLGRTPFGWRSQKKTTNGNTAIYWYFYTTLYTQEDKRTRPSLVTKITQNQYNDKEFRKNLERLYRSEIFPCEPKTPDEYRIEIEQLRLENDQLKKKLSIAKKRIHELTTKIQDIRENTNKREEVVSLSTSPEIKSKSRESSKNHQYFLYIYPTFIYFYNDHQDRI